MDKPLQFTLPDALADAMAATATAEGKTLDEVAIEAIQRDLSRRTLERLQREGDARRRGMSDQEVDEIVDQAIRELRQRDESTNRL